jgi:hypothetical protein
MSQLRLGRNPDGTRTILELGPAVGRRTFTRYGSRGGPTVIFGSYPVGESTRARDLRMQKDAMARSRKFVDLTVMETSDNGGVQVPSPEVSS